MKKPARKLTKKAARKSRTPAKQTLFNELSMLIEHGQKTIVASLNSTLALLFWQVGKKINENILQNKRANYGKRIVVTVSRQLQRKYGSNFEEKNLRRMMQFAEQFPDAEIVVTLSRQLSWSHFLLLFPLKKAEAKVFYAEKAAQEGWGVRELRRQIETKSFERTAIAKVQLKDVKLTAASIFKDPYLFDFLGLKDDYLEKDLESAILRELENFLLEMGRGFAFLERQKRMIIDGEDFYLDLLFYHRTLKRLVAVELKLDKFNAKYKGQMELYLKWLDRYERQEGEESPIGLILCAESSREQVELLDMHKNGIMVAEYWTELPPKKELQKRLHKAMIEARERLEKRKAIE